MRYGRVIAVFFIAVGLAIAPLGAAMAGLQLGPPRSGAQTL